MDAAAYSHEGEAVSDFFALLRLLALLAFGFGVVWLLVGHPAIFG